MEIHQLKHSEISNWHRKFPIIVICDNITSPDNVGMIFRISEAMGVEKILLCRKTACPPNNRIKKTSRSTIDWLDFSICPDINTELENVKGLGYKVFCLEITNASTSLSKLTIDTKDKIALVVGAENEGVQQSVLSKADIFVDIEMFGKNTSINVVNALAITLYEFTKQLNG